jgi:MFS family permease
MLIDLITFVVAIVVVFLIQIPQPKRTKESMLSEGTIWKELVGGFRFLLDRRIMLYLMIFSAGINFLLSGPMNLNTPYIITLTGSEQLLGILLGAMNVGIVVGGIVVAIWGGTRPRVHGMMLGLLFRAVWIVIYGFARTPAMLGLSLFFIFFTTLLVDASFMSIVQLKVPPDMQGRVFALLFQMMYIATPLSMLLTGPLVDRWLEPAVASSGWATVALLVGDQPGSGMGLLYPISGGLSFLLVLGLYLWPKARSVEADLPDYIAGEELTPTAT